MTQYAPPRRTIPWFIAAMPAYTAGFLAPVPFIYAAVQWRLRKLWFIAAAYVAVWTVPWVLLAAIDSGNHALNTVGDRLHLALAIGGTIHAFALRGSLPRRPHPQYGQSAGRYATVRPQPPITTPAAAPVSDPTQTMCAQVRGALAPLKYSAITHAELFSPTCKQLLDETIAQIDQVVSLVANGGHAGAELRSVHAIATDYLPTSINTYVRLPREFAESQRNPGGLTAAEELELALRLLRDKVKEAANSLHHVDALRLQQQSAFLRDKFGNSELDLS